MGAPLRWGKPAPHGAFWEGLAVQSAQNENAGLLFKKCQECQGQDSRALKARVSSHARAGPMPVGPARP